MDKDKDMYSYHYYKHRCINKSSITMTDCVFHLSTLSFLLYAGTLLLKLIKM